jgi:microcystin-dependent protein
VTANSDSPDVGRRLRAVEEAVYNLQRERSDVESTSDRVKTGTIAASLTSAVPQGWLLLNGQTISATDWPALAAYLTSHSLSLTLPDMRNRFLVGAGAAYASGATGGSADAVVVAHDHDIDANTTQAEAAGMGLAVLTAFEDRVLVSGTATDMFTATTGVSGTDANLPPYLAVYWMIRT